MEELKPCPLCGKPAHITETTITHYIKHTVCSAKIECFCGLTFERRWVQGEVYFNVRNKEDIITAWNRRV